MLREATKRRTPPYGAAALSIPPPREPLDSSPTPVLSLGWRDLHARFTLLSSRFKSQALVYAKHPLKIDFKKSKACIECEVNLVAMATRIEKWPHLSPSGLTAEKSYMAEQYLNYMDIAQELIGEGRII